MTVRGGGHSYLGASAGTGLVIDLRPLNAVGATAGIATIGAGAALIDVYAGLAGRGVGIPSGSCPAVGVTGITLGGGMGVVGRAYGLSCDRLESADVVLADGRMVTASATSEPDLFWALRGGGAGFGVVTSLRFRTHATQSLALFSYRWPWSSAPRVLEGWQRFLPEAPDGLWSTCHLLATTGDSATASVSGVYVGSSSQLGEQLRHLLDAVGVPPASSYLRDKGYLAGMLVEAGCADRSVAGCHVAGQTAGATLPRDAFVAASDFFAAPVPAAGVEAVVRAVQQRQDDPALGVGGVAFDHWGGAVSRVAPGVTAFVHRDVLMSAQYTASWADQPGNSSHQRNQASLDLLHAAARPYATGAAYQNYADPTLSNPLRAYYGANLPRLQAIKRNYDPTGLLTPPQGVTP